MTELHHHNRIHALEVELGFFLFLTWSIKFIQMSVCVSVLSLLAITVKTGFESKSGF